VSDIETQLQQRPGHVVTTLRVEVVDGPDRGAHAVGGDVLSVGGGGDVADREHLDVARRFLDARVRLCRGFFDAASVETSDADLIVVPLSFIGDREYVYRNPPAAAVLVHDWLWKRRGHGIPISWLLLKRLNLVTR